MYYMKIVLISCLNFNRAIGSKNKLIYNLKGDLKHFKKTTLKVKDKTKQNAVLMGRKTFLSMNSTLLKNRKNIIISNNKYFLKNYLNKNKNNKDMILFNTIDKSIDFCQKDKSIETLYIIGGECIYDYFIKQNIADKIILTEIKNPINNFGDIFFPNISNNYALIKSKSYEETDVLCNVSNTKYPKISYDINDYINTSKNNISSIKTDEYNYLNVLKDVLYYGKERQTRNSKTISKFGIKMEFNDINEHFPLLTTKKMYWKGIKEELLWFINGDTNSTLLEDKHVNIWKGNSNRDFLDNNQFSHYQEGECGPIYGFQWRHFNAPYPIIDNKNKGGIDQLQNCIDLIKSDPYSRRIFMSSWNPCQLKDMVLPPCHVSYQFYVTDDGKIDCQMYQRSGDIFLGVPFNIASTALLTSMIANITGYSPGKISIIIGDAHIYKNHIESIEEQLTRKPYGFPKLYIKNRNTIDEFNSNDLQLVSYYSHKSIKSDMIS